jgi:intracellular multiplication protein IcmB
MTDSLAFKVVDRAADLLYGISNLFAGNAESYVQIESANSKHSLVARDGALVSLIRIDGSLNMVGSEEFDQIVTTLDRAIRPALTQGGHEFQFVFLRDPDESKRVIREALEPSYQTARNMGLDVFDLLDDKVETLSKFTAVEQAWLVVWTDYAGLTKAQRQDAMKDRFNKARETPAGKGAQNMTPAADIVRDAHESMVSGIVSDIQRADILVELLDTHEALADMRRANDPDYTDDGWRALLPGDPLPKRHPVSKRPLDFTELLYPRLGDQIFPRGAGEIRNMRQIEIGDRIHAPLAMSIGPNEVRHFQVLFNRLLNGNIPYRASFSLARDGVSALNFNATLASILRFGSGRNKQIHSAAESIKKAVEAGEILPRLRILFDTWAPASSDPEVIRTRASLLARAVQGWGTCETTDITGDPLMGTTSTLPGVSRLNPAPVLAPPLHQALKMLPVTRPTSPWRVGAMIMRTPDGKAMPYQPGSALQAAWLELFFAPPRFGKSVSMATRNLALILSPGLKRLPLISILDVGPSSRGLISLLESALPAGRAHEVGYFRMRMEEKYAINPFDLPLMLARPLPIHREFLSNLLLLLCTPSNAEAPYDGVAGLVGEIITRVYDKLAPESGGARRYEPRIDAKVDALMAELNIVPDVATTWWEVTEELFDRDYTHEAALAQRYAMPNLTDCAQAVMDQNLAKIYSGVTPTQEKLTEFVWRSINDAISKFPIFNGVTAFDLSDVRVASLDLQEVCPDGNDPLSKRQTTIMYMLGRHVLCAKFYVTPEDLEAFPLKAAAFHRKRVVETAEDLKSLCMDEFHRTDGNPTVRAQVMRDIREGPKWKVLITLLSQRLADFDQAMIDLSSTVAVLGAGKEQEIQSIVKTFGLNATAESAVRRIKRPDAKGAMALYQFQTKRGNMTQLAYNTLGAIERWAYATNADERIVRDRLYGLMAPAKARALLAQKLPKGPDERLEQIRASFSDDSDDSAYDILIAELLGTAKS